MALFMLLLCGSVRLGAQKPAPSFDADVLTFYKLADGQVISTTGHTYRGSDGRTREDTAQGSVIIDPKGRTVTLLTFANKQALVIDLKSVPPPQARNASIPSATPFGRTILEGHEAAKARSVGPQGEKIEMWTAVDVNAVVFTRAEAPGMTTTRYLRNIAVREPDPQLFEVPKGYSVTKQSPPPGFDPMKSTGFPGSAAGRGNVPGVERGGK